MKATPPYHNAVEGRHHRRLLSVGEKKEKVSTRAKTFSVFLQSLAGPVQKFRWGSGRTFADPEATIANKVTPIHPLELHSNFRRLQSFFSTASFPPQLQNLSVGTVPTVTECPLHVAMESLADTLWDVVICGTGLQQSLLAL